MVRVWEGTDAAARNLGEVALLPGLINAHTHLQFSDLKRPLAPGATFPDWIRAVIGQRLWRKGDARTAIAAGWDESVASGTAAVGEIATADATYGELANRRACGVVYREVLGLSDDAVAAGLDTARRHLAEPADESPALRRGLSPHAPYSLHPDLFRGLVAQAAGCGAPVAIHLAETREELELLAHGRGGLVDLLSEMEVWRPEFVGEFRRPLDYLRELSRCRSVLVVHGNYLAEDELDFLATQPQMTVVYCPRTHAAFGHDPHPWLRMRERGIRVVIGTDSRASNPDLSLPRELQWLRARYPRVSTRELIRMATRDAAEALGLSEICGSLTPGRRAACCIVTPSRPLTPDNWDGLCA